MRPDNMREGLIFYWLTYSFCHCVLNHEFMISSLVLKTKSSLILLSLEPISIWVILKNAFIAKNVERVDFYPNKDSHVHKYYDLITGRNLLNLKVSGKEIVLTFVIYLYAKKEQNKWNFLVYSSLSFYNHFEDKIYITMQNIIKSCVCAMLQKKRYCYNHVTR